MFEDVYKIVLYKEFLGFKEEYMNFDEALDFIRDFIFFARGHSRLGYEELRFVDSRHHNILTVESSYCKLLVLNSKIHKLDWDNQMI